MAKKKSGKKSTTSKARRPKSAKPSDFDLKKSQGSRPSDVDRRLMRTRRRKK